MLEKARDTNKYFVAGNTIVYERIPRDADYGPQATVESLSGDNEVVSLIYPKKTTLASRLHLSEYDDLKYQGTVCSLCKL